jgi:Rrf2 family transcriptional regulator, cysteine metabolism repressor
MMLAIARLSSAETPIALGDTAKYCQLSRKYMDQLMPPLKNAGLVRGLMGRSGGYMLGREPGDITIREIVEAAIGPIAITECSGDTTDCDDFDICSCRELWVLINGRIRQCFEEFTLADLLSEGWSDRVSKEIAKLG